MCVLGLSSPASHSVCACQFFYMSKSTNTRFAQAFLILVMKEQSLLSDKQKHANTDSLWEGLLELQALKGPVIERRGRSFFYGAFAIIYKTLMCF